MVHHIVLNLILFINLLLKGVLIIFVRIEYIMIKLKI